MTVPVILRYKFMGLEEQQRKGGRGLARRINFDMYLISVL